VLQELFELGALAEAPASQELLPTAAPGSRETAEATWGQDEAEVVSKEFHGLQVKHHLTHESLEQQQQQLRRQEAAAVVERRGVSCWQVAHLG
jgi:hypothetical protein